MEKLGQDEMDHRQRQVVCISQDSFYRELNAAESLKASKGLFNFDHPGISIACMNSLNIGWRWIYSHRCFWQSADHPNSAGHHWRQSCSCSSLWLQNKFKVVVELSRHVCSDPLITCFDYYSQKTGRIYNHLSSWRPPLWRDFGVLFPGNPEFFPHEIICRHRCWHSVVSER